MGVRQRKSKKKAKNIGSNNNSQEQKDPKDRMPPASPALPASSEEDSEPTLWETFRSHPLIVVLPIIGIPYLFYQAYYLFVLQHPELVPGGFLRPGVGLSDPRQLLVVGTMSSGTVQTAADLFDTLQLEIGHEASDTSWYFVRDGTVSWFHGWRYLEAPPEEKDRVQSLLMLCNGNFTQNMGFHPKMYRSTSGCSDRVRWDRCWKRECLQLLNDEWGCGLRGECQTPFARVLHQIRNPIRTIESLVMKFCLSGNADLDTAVTHPALVKFVQAMFPSNANFTDTTETPLSCVETVALYVWEYNTAMIRAREGKRVIHSMYKVEATSPCDIAELAGLTNLAETLYEPNYERIQNICYDGSLDRAMEHMQSTKHKINEGVVDLELSDLMGGLHGSKRKKDDARVHDLIRDLMVTMGYDTSIRKPKEEKKEVY